MMKKSESLKFKITCVLIPNKYHGKRKYWFKVYYKYDDSPHGGSIIWYPKKWRGKKIMDAGEQLGHGSVIKIGRW